jgi:drug/metabolite transporter (DMT)-like permease
MLPDEIWSHGRMVTTSAVRPRPTVRSLVPRPRRPPMSSSTLAVVALLAVTLTWGSTFPLLKDVVTRVPVPDLLAVRFAVATLALVALRPTALRGLSSRTVLQGAVLGLGYGVAQVLQTLGLQHTSAAVSGFVTSAYVVLTPVLGALVLRRRVTPVVWAAVVISTLGLGVLSLRGLAIGAGELLTLLSAAFFALHILGLGAWATARDAYGVAVVQLAVVTVVCAAAAAPGGIALPRTGADLLVVGYLAVVAGAAALVVQTWAQAHIAPERAAVVMTLEPLWAAGFAVALGGETLGPRVALGGTLVLLAMLVCERPDLPARGSAAVRTLGGRLLGAARPREGRQPGCTRTQRPRPVSQPAICPQ